MLPASSRFQIPSLFSPEIPPSPQSARRSPLAPPRLSLSAAKK